MFGNKHSGVEVNYIIENLDEFAPEEDGEDYWELSVHEFEGDVKDIDPNLLQWVRDQIDYDTTKHEYYYFEGEEIQ